MTPKSVIKLSVPDGDGRLGSKHTQQIGVIGGKGARRLGHDVQNAQKLLALADWDAHHRRPGIALVGALELAEPALVENQRQHHGDPVLDEDGVLLVVSLRQAPARERERRKPDYHRHRQVRDVEHHRRVGIER